MFKVYNKKVGANYYVWELGSDTNKSSSQLSANVKHYCLLLPQLFPTTESYLTSSEKSYTLIDSEWNEISLDKTVTVPEFHLNTHSI